MPSGDTVGGRWRGWGVVEGCRRGFEAISLV